jgi:Cdc6-like AAA superfamily ATPase
VVIVAQYVSSTKATVERLYQDSQRNQIHSWLSPPDVSINLNEASSKRYEGTGLWFLESEQFQQWKSGARKHLWIHGMPGCGKTILSSTIIKHLHRDRVQSSHVVLEFFDFNDTDKQMVNKMFRSLVTQLYFRCEKSRKELDTLFSKCEYGRQQPTTEALFATLHGMMSFSDKVQIIIDALDECRERREMIQWMQKLVNIGDQRLYLLLTSRQESDIESGLKSCILEKDFISIQQNAVDGDIREYIRGIIHGDNEFGRWQSKPSVLEEIEVELMKKAGGM